MTVTIRPATPDDLPALMPLVEEMRRFHEDPTEFLTEEALRRDGFGADPAFSLFVAEETDSLLGYALFQDAYETAYAARGFYLNDLFVIRGARQKGVGRLLLKAVGAEARRRNRVYVWWVAQAWNDEAKRFYEALGAEATAVSAFALTTSALESL